LVNIPANIRLGLKVLTETKATAQSGESATKKIRFITLTAGLCTINFFVNLT
jgi:hypothetical protein